MNARMCLHSCPNTFLKVTILGFGSNQTFPVLPTYFPMESSEGENGWFVRRVQKSILMALIPLLLRTIILMAFEVMPAI